jgi:DNA-binding SARP family transcriptional activator
LQVYVSRLRQALGDDAIDSRGEGYVLRVASDAIDAGRFDHLVGVARRQLEVDPTAAAATLRQALALWRGSPWGPLGDEPALRGSRQRLEEQRLEAVASRIEADLASGQVTGLAGELESLLVDHPLREDLYALLLRVLYRQGRQADALAAFRALRRVLDDELGIEPSPELQRLHERILRQDPTLAPAGSPPPRSDDDDGLPDPDRALDGPPAEISGRPAVQRLERERLDREPRAPGRGDADLRWLGRW